MLAHHRYTWKEYLAFETSTNAKNEFLDGEIFAMAGGTPQHANLAARIIGDLRPQLKGGPCEAYTSDLRVRVGATGLATYPDVSVLCGPLETDPEDSDTALNPTLIVEVLSNSTEEYDRGQKFEHYQKIVSLREYVLVSHREPLIEVFRKTPAGEWARTEARVHARIELQSVRGELSVDSIYEGVALRP